MQITALSALKTRQIRLFSDAISDERSDINAPYDSADDSGFPKTLLTVAVEQWSAPSDSVYVSLLLANGATLDTVDDATERAPIHDIVRKGKPELVRVMLQYVDEKTNINVPDGEGLTVVHCAVEQLQVIRAETELFVS